VCRASADEGLRVCIALLGDVEPELLAYLTDYYASQYGIALHILPPLSISQDLLVVETQYSADWLLDLARDAYAIEAADPAVRLIAITPVDIWLESKQSWRWAFGKLSAGEDGGPGYPHAILSTYRMDDRSWGPYYDEEAFRTRVRTMLNKYVAVSYFGLPFSPEPASATYDNILSARDLDGMAEHIPVP
jgi:predicted Zn-dependent protease